jgi:uncharacterized protein YjbI with pentapeptide repeats
MHSATIGKGNLEGTAWDGNYFKFCTFDEFSQEGGVIGSDFLSCSFRKIDWYWGLFTSANFIDCEFVDCVFRGSTFADTRFVECRLTNCRFICDNLDAGCTFPGTVAYGCSLTGGEGFNVEVRN